LHGNQHVDGALSALHLPASINCRPDPNGDPDRNTDTYRNSNRNALEREAQQNVDGELGDRSCSDGKRFSVRADEKLSAFMALELAICPKKLEGWNDS